MSDKRVCPKCGGSGTVLNDKKVGAFMRSLRIHAKVTGRALARRLGWSAAYLCDLELGRRAWNAEKREKYQRALS